MSTANPASRRAPPQALEVEKLIGADRRAAADQDKLFDGVRAKLAANQLGQRGPCSRSEALLLRKLFDDRGNRMTLVIGRKGPIRYRYYASHATTQGLHSDAGSS